MRGHAGAPTLLLVAGFVATACAGRAPYNPWLIPEQRFFAQTKTIAIWPLLTPNALERPEPVRATFDSLIEATLRGAGYLIVAGHATAPAWKRLVDSAGGYFDQRTGQPDSVKRELLRQRLLSELRERFHADAVLYPSLVIVSANFREHRASWDGTSQTIEGTGSFLLRALAGINRTGRTDALSLRVAIEDMSGVNMFVNRGGIQVWSKPAGGKFEQVPRDQLFVDPERNVRGVQIALGPVLTRASPTQDF